MSTFKKPFLFLFLIAMLVAASAAFAGGPAFTVTNVDDPDPVASGAQITYTITIGNAGGSSQSGVTMTDQLNGVGGIGVPPQLQITSSRGSCTQSTTLVTCNAGTVEGRGAWVVTIRGIVVAPSGTVINNTASVSSNKQPQGSTTPATATTLVMGGTGGGPLPDLSISKNGPTSVAVSSPMTYTLTVNNTGTQNATGVKVVDTVPAGLTGITATGTSLFVCSVAGQTVTCTGGAVNFGSNATVTINATSPAVTGTITNTAAVDPDNTIAESNELNNTSALVNTAVTVAPPLPPLSVDVTDDGTHITGAGPDPVTPGDLLTYKILVTNNSTNRADDVNIVDGFQGLVASSMTVNQVVTNGTVGTAGGCSINASQAKCVDQFLQAGGTILMTVTGQVIQSAGSTLLNTATVSGTIKNKGQNSTDTEITTVKPGIDLTITSVGTPDPVCARSWPASAPPPTFLPSPVCPGGLTYTFVVGNSGIQTASGVLVRDPLPAGTIFDHAVAPAFGGGCSVDSSNVLTCTNGTIAPQSITTITIVLVAPPGTGTIQNTVYVDPNNAIFEADETNNTATTSTFVKTGIDLTVRKLDAFDPIATSGTQTYTITVDNVGPQDATNIRVRDILPFGTIFRSAQGDHNFTCSFQSITNFVECTGGMILGTASEFYPALGPIGEDHATITITIFASPIVGTMHNEVRVDPLNTIAEVDETNNIAFQDTVVGPGGAAQSAFNEFTISKSQLSPDPNNTARNAKVTYQIVVGNDGTDPAFNVVVRDFLPAGSHYIEATGTNSFLCSQVSNFINCVGGQIPGHAAMTPVPTATITVTAFAPDTPGTYFNQAIVDPDNAIPEGNEFDNQASAKTVVVNGGAGAFYELSITKTQTSPNPLNTARNAPVTYKIVVTNSGTDPLNGIKVRDTLPAGARFISATGTNQFLCSQAIVGTIDCTGGQLLSGGSATITVKAFAPDTPGTYTNQAFVDPDNTIPEGDEFNNQATADTVVVNGGDGAFNDLQILKTGTSNTVPGGEIEYSLQVWNNGSDAALNVAVRDVLPAGETFVSASDNGTGPGGPFTCSNAGSIVNCTGGTLIGGGVGNARTITIKAKAPSTILDAAHALRNTAVIDPDNTIPEGDEFNNTSSKDTTVTSRINLTITKNGPTTASQSDVTDYTIKVTNNIVSGPGDNAIGVLVVDPLPVGLIPLAVDAGSGNNFACQISQNPINLVQCLGDLPPGGDVTIKITVFITAENGRSLDNTACVDPNNTIVESNELDNCSEFGSFVAPAPPSSPDILVSKQVDSLSTSPGSPLQYTISISNVGTAKAKGWDGVSGLTLTDTLSSDVTFTTVTTTNGWTCDTTGLPTIVCHDSGTGMNPGDSAQVTISVNVNASASSPIGNAAVAAPALVADCTDPNGCTDETSDHLDNNTSHVVSSLGSSGIDLSIATITDNPDPVAPGQGLKYTIVGVNGGTAPANGVHISITIPSSGVTFQSADGSNGFNCAAPVGTTIDCVGDLGPGGNTVITVSFITLLSGLPPDITVTATIDPADAFAETNEGNNTKSQTTTITTAGACSACVDLVASQLIASPEPVQTGHPLTVKFQIVNTGDTPSTLNPASQALLFFDTVTDGTVTSATPTSSVPGITCQVDGTTSNALFTSCKGNLNPGQGATITLSYTVTGTKVSIHGQLDPGGFQTEANEGNNELTQTVVIVP